MDTRPAFTPFFPAWKACLVPRRKPLAQSLAQLAAGTLCQLESRFAGCLPSALFAKAPSGANSRDRAYTQSRTFWCFLWQCLQVGCSGREVVRQLQALLALHGAGAISCEDGAYCVARQRLPQSVFPQALQATAAAAERLAPSPSFLQGRPVKIVDGTTVSLPDTPLNQAAYPQVSTMKKGCSFPIMRIVAVFSLASGAILAAHAGSLCHSEWRLFYQMLAHLAPVDIVIADRGFGHYAVLALLQAMKIDFIARSSRSIDGRRRHRRLGPNDWLVTWKKSPNPSAVLPQQQGDPLPAESIVRIVRGSLHQPGFRVRQITVVTTLLDAQAYPAADILRAYLRRWRLEMCLDDLKTTLGMHTLRCKSPAMARKEMFMHLIAHNLIRHTMAQAAAEHDADMERLSFKGTVDALRQFTHAMAQARSKKKREELWAYLLRILVGDRVPDRPGRREPRAVKRRSMKYERLTVPRGHYKDRPKRHQRRRLSRLRRLSLA
jgi:Transposase DDE domain